MAALRAQSEPSKDEAERRTKARRKLHLEVQGWGGLGSSEVAVVDLSTTGLLLETSDALNPKENIEFDLPGTGTIRATVKWSSGRLFGCQFKEPITKAAVSAALLRAPLSPPAYSSPLEPASAPYAAGMGQLQPDGQVSLHLEMRWIVGLALLCWAIVAASAFLGVRFFV